jgi:hypothetical protein
MFRGGESQKSKAFLNAGYSDKAHCTGKPAYLKPNSNSMQKPIGGLSQTASENYIKRGYKSPQAPSCYLRMLHCSTFGQIKHSSGNGSPSGKVFKSPEKCAHFAGESNTVGYSVALTPTTFILSITISNFDMQNGHA